MSPAWQSALPTHGAHEPLPAGTQTLSGSGRFGPSRSDSQLSPPVHAADAQALQAPPRDVPPQHPRQYASSSSPMHSVQGAQYRDTSQRAPGTPVAVHIPPAHPYPGGHCAGPVHWGMGQVSPTGTQYLRWCSSTSQEKPGPHWASDTQDMEQKCVRPPVRQMPEPQSCPEVQNRQRSAEPTLTRHAWTAAPPLDWAAWHAVPAGHACPAPQSDVQMNPLPAACDPRHLRPAAQLASEPQGLPRAPALAEAG